MFDMLDSDAVKPLMFVELKRMDIIVIPGHG